MAATLHDTEALVRLSRRHLWFALVMILLLGITGMLASGGRCQAVGSSTPDHFDRRDCTENRSQGRLCKPG
jgi:hypothetical protein